MCAVHFSTSEYSQIKFTCRVFTECLNLREIRKETEILQFISEISNEEETDRRDFHWYGYAHG